MLSTASVEYGHGGLSSSGFLLDMPKVFEGFLATALGDALTRRHGGRLLREPRHHLDLAGRVELKPDLVWQRRQQDVAVLDATYKAGRPIEDIYQMLAYCTALDIPRGHLVYAAGTPTGHVVRNAGTEITCHSLDLATAPAGLLAQIHALAAGLARGTLVTDAPPASGRVGTPQR